MRKLLLLMVLGSFLTSYATQTDYDFIKCWFKDFKNCQTFSKDNILFNCNIEVSPDYNSTLCKCTRENFEQISKASTKQALNTIAICILKKKGLFPLDF